MALGVECWEFWALGIGFRELSMGLWVESFWFKVWGAELGVVDFEFGVEGFRFRV